MAICTICGTLMHEKDVATHVCKTGDIPEKGKPVNLKDMVKDEIAKDKAK